ncbi:MAG TPA: DinB family protein [Streptosporangiaceae bacterium]|nr:DinB family protein [Streptosporangiaceae bacterium]
MTTHWATTVEANHTVLWQGIGALRHWGTALFRLSGPGGRPTSVGPHFRHIIDHYRCWFRGVEGGRVDYDARDRDPLLERDPGCSADAMTQLAIALRALAPDLDSRSLLVHTAAVPGEDPAPAWTGSTVERELHFLLSHTVHHYALISLMARHGGIELGEEFGVAASTLAYWRRNPACAR